MSAKDLQPYILLPDKSDDRHLNVQIVRGPYEGIRYRYTIVSLKEETEEGARFDVRFEFLEGKQKADRNFADKVVGAILNDILEKISAMPEQDPAPDQDAGATR